MDALKALGSAGFFRDVLDASALERLAGAARPVTFAKGAPLMRQGEIGASLFLIESGKVAVSVHEPGGARKLARLGPGDIVGEMSLLTGARRSATVTAEGKVAAFEIGKLAMEPILAAAPGLVDRFAAMMEQRQGELARQHSDLARWNAVGLGRAEIAARMTAFYSG
ncbi:MAG TPA: cyclic nucleotide-binding domain-containing protein [Bauldia sp.]|nr:cyclic nucleotide-binding domain-containing protein [Bauldia sp.]